VAGLPLQIHFVIVAPAYSVSRAPCAGKPQNAVTPPKPSKFGMAVASFELQSPDLACRRFSGSYTFEPLIRYLAG